MTDEATQQDQYTDEITRLYELGFHLIPSIADDKLEGEVQQLRQLIEQHGGEITQERFPKQMQLAYAMEHRTQSSTATYETAYFGWIKFQMQPDGVEAVQEELRENTSVLRFIVVKTVPEADGAEEDEVLEADEEAGEVTDETATDAVPQAAATTATDSEAGDGAATTATEQQQTDEQLDRQIDELVGDQEQQTGAQTEATGETAGTATEGDETQRT
jgi:ribosomal protein S6